MSGDLTNFESYKMYCVATSLFMDIHESIIIWVEDPKDGCEFNHNELLEQLRHYTLLCMVDDEPQGLMWAPYKIVGHGLIHMIEAGIVDSIKDFILVPVTYHPDKIGITGVNFQFSEQFL